MISAILIVLTGFFLFVPTVFAQSVVVNEFIAHPSLGNDWIELYNSSGTTINLNGWTLSDNTSTMKSLTGTLTATSLVTFEVSNRLNNAGDSIYLKDPSGITIDSYTYNSDPGIDTSISRNPDGGSWNNVTIPSPTSSNSYSTPSNNPSPTSSSKSSFIISDVPSQINSEQSFPVYINLTLPNNLNTGFYLKGAFKKADGSNYFGLTKVSSSWIKNGSKYSDQYPITTDSSGYWSGTIDVEPDPEDSGFEGSGEYIFKVGRYSSSGSGPTWSNEISINITGSPIEEETKNTTSKITLPTSSKPTGSSIKKELGKIKTALATVAGISKQSSPSSTSSTPTPTDEVEVKSEKSINFLLFLGAGLILIGLIFIIYIFTKQKLQSS